MNSGIVNLGICTVDAIARHVSEFPPPGGLRFFDNLTINTGGNALNASVTLARMGLPCRMVVKVGDDSHGRFILDRARELRSEEQTSERQSRHGISYAVFCLKKNMNRVPC